MSANVAESLAAIQEAAEELDDTRLAELADEAQRLLAEQPA